MTRIFGGTPDWVRDAVFYQVFPDRFAKSDRVPKAGNLETWESPPTLAGYKGGDLLGVAERLDYLQDLGITGLYLTPVFQSASNHRYHTHDYYRVDPMLGGDAALRELIDSAHGRGMRVVIDGVFNHASRGFFQFNDLLESGRASAYLDWFHVRHFPLHAYGGGELGYDAWWNIAALPKFNTRTPAVREFLFGVAEYWLRFGADGWRLDVPNEIDDDGFWREFRARCRAVASDAYLVGEIWDDAARWLQGDMFDGVMNYPLTRAIFGLVGRQVDHGELSRSGLNGIAPLGAAGFADSVTRLLRRHPEEAVAGQLNLLGSHDTPRVLTSLGGDAVAARQALFLLFVMPGAPCVYYGDELGLAGGHDPNCRQALPWDEVADRDDDTFELVRALTRLRARHTALRRGAAGVTANDVGMVAVRRGERGEVTALLNVSDEPARVDHGLLPAGTYRDLFADRVVRHGVGDAGQPLSVEPRGWLLLERLQD
ncbi:MAG TPA: glycoside hydrolase family 13 protein [Trueperaceae bacterium]|nr:glycoside hydrolase family 13 protein [Trueperaceae bacterium]